MRFAKISTIKCFCSIICYKLTAFGPHQHIIEVKLLSFVAGGSTVSSAGGLMEVESKLSMPLANVKTAADLNDRAMQHPLCIRNATAYVGQTAKMYCCLARLDRELSVSNEAVRPSSALGGNELI